jgi:hypothetical protein
MIAAENKRRSRKVIAPFDRKRAITEKKRPAESLKHGAASCRRRKHFLRFARASHGKYRRCIASLSDYA